MDDDQLSKLVKQARRSYKKKWRDANREHIRQYNKEWVKQNPDKIRERDQRYWQRKALQMIQGDSVTDKHTVTKQVKENVTDSVTDSVTVTDQPPACIVCGKPIHSRRVGAVYCSAPCKQKHYRQTHSRKLNF